MVEGSYLDPADPYGVLVHNAFAEERGVGVGDKLTVRVGGSVREFRVRGIVVTAEYFFLRRTKDEIPEPRGVRHPVRAVGTVETLGGLRGAHELVRVPRR